MTPDYLIPTPKDETEAQKEERLRLQQARYNAWRDQVAQEGIGRLLTVERVSSLPIEDFFRAVLKVATNDSVLIAILQEGDWSKRLPGERPPA